MSFIAKIFVVINLLLAALFCGFSLSLYARRVDYKTKWRDTEKEMTSLEAELNAKIEKLDGEREEAEKKLMTSDKSLKDTQSRLDNKLKEYEDLGGRYLEKEEMVKKLVDLGKMKDDELQRLYARIEEMHLTILKQQTALAVAKRRERIAENRRIEMEDELNDSRHQLAQMRKEKARLEKDLAHEAWVLQRLIDAGVPVNDIVYTGVVQPTTPIKAKVVGVNNEVDLVLLSQGSDSKVKPGYQFIVFRGDKYIGKVEVEKVLPRMSSARILRDRLKQGENIKEGDDAATAIY